MQSFLQAFAVPQVACSVIDRIVLPEEQRVIESLKTGLFSEEDVLAGFADAAYKRGIFSLSDESCGGASGGCRQYRLSSFYGRLDVFVISEPETYRSFPLETRKALDDWYFDAYYKQLSVPQDTVITQEEAFERIDKDERQVYLAPCDCRSLSGTCGKPVKTCLSWRSGANTFADRGLSEAIGKEKAKQVVLEAEKAGLMHTANPNTICNCCGDCCYLFRARRRMQAEHRSISWLKSAYVISYNEALCIKCGKCVSRCNVGVFTAEKETGKNSIKKITVQLDECVGCGICVPVCPAHALVLKRA
ncbi:MAG: 4Fe-4S dicluster domain-containing protein [Spirochaetaceae bacterium]|jgi:NAD-dependent dihydropyrimidine dehydrogenase PreA subunit|nr:4Fe-4S dicluster domain-containing protein [Spirochaetaceae bacterium]